MPVANMQYKKLGFSKLFNICTSYQGLYTLKVNRFELPNFSYCCRYQQA